jgi:hypothetical protein
MLNQVMLPILPVVKEMNNMNTKLSALIENYLGIDFNIDAEKSNVPRGEGKSELRQVSIDIVSDTNNKEVFMEHLKVHLDGNIIMYLVLDNNNPQALDHLMDYLNIKKVLFDLIIFRYYLEYEDDLGREASLEAYHGIGFTVTGKRYLEELA